MINGMSENDEIKKQIQRCVALASVLFFFSISLGWRMAIQNTEEVERILGQTLSQFSQLRGLNAFMIFLFIFLNNAIKGFFVIVLGFLFGIVPLMFVFLNGQLVGFLLGISQIRELGIGRMIAGIAPHGILEIPAIMLSAGYGIWLGYRFYRFFWRKDSFRIYFSFALKKYFTLILPLLFVAALIESFVTPYVIDLLR